MRYRLRCGVDELVLESRLPRSAFIKKSRERPLCTEPRFIVIFHHSDLVRCLYHLRHRSLKSPGTWKTGASKDAPGALRDTYIDKLNSSSVCRFSASLRMRAMTTQKPTKSRGVPQFDSKPFHRRTFGEPLRMNVQIPSTDSEWLSIPEARRRLRCGSHAFARLLESGRLSLLRVPNSRVKVRAEDVERVLEDSLRPATVGSAT